MTVRAAVVACGCSNYLKKADSVRNLAKKQEIKELKTGKQTSSEVQYNASTDKTTQELMKTLTKKTDKKTLDKPCEGIRAFLRTGEISVFRNNTYQVPLST